MGNSALLLLAVVILDTVLVWILVCRRAYRSLPLFLVYLITSALIDFLRFVVSANYSVYFYVYWSTDPVYAAVALLVLYEVFHWVFLEFYKYWNWFWLLFPSAVATAAGTAAWYAFRHPPQTGSRLISFILDFSIAVNLIQLGIALLFFGLVWVLELYWWAYSFAVVFGFGIASAGALVGYWSFATYGTGFKMVVKYAPPVAYIVAVVFWLFIFARPEPEFKLPPGVTREQLLERARKDLEIVERLRRKLNMRTLTLAGVLAAVTALIFGRRLYRRLFDLVDPNILDAIPFLTEVKYEPLEALLDAASERYLRLNLGEKEFRKAQQKRMKVLLRLAEQINRNARVLVAVGQHDRMRGCQANEAEWETLGQELVTAAINVRAGMAAMCVVLRKRLIKAALFPYTRTADIAPLKSFEGFDLFGAYQNMVNAALDLAAAYGDDVHARLCDAL